jgi:hypothetical protein
MQSPQPIPNTVILLKGHPAGRDEKVEDEVHDEQQYDQVEDLPRGGGTMVMERLSLRLTM